MPRDYTQQPPIPGALMSDLVALVRELHERHMELGTFARLDARFADPLPTDAAASRAGILDALTVVSGRLLEHAQQHDDRVWAARLLDELHGIREIARLPASIATESAR